MDAEMKLSNNELEAVVDTLNESFKEATVDEIELPGMDCDGTIGEIEETVEEIIEGSETVDESVQKTRHPKTRICELPLSKIKGIMKMDPEVAMVSSEAVFVVAKATELFLHALSEQTVHYTLAQKKKTIQRSHVDSAVQNSNCLYFLEDALD